jgi:RNA polymerase sigma factor (sigma-70 family)
MADANQPLRAVLVEKYEQLFGQLKRQLRSPELAREALHDTYLRLERGNEIPAVKHPVGYLLRIAVNLARDRQSSGNRIATVAEIEAAFHLIDRSPDPARTAEARSDLEAVERAVLQLPPRQRAILLASSKEGMTSRQIALRFSLSVRKIDMELKLAREHCARALLAKPKK